jgi:hypothetical protein
MTPLIDRAQNERVVPEPPADETPESHERGIHAQDQPQVRSGNNEEGHVNADVVGPVRQSHKSDGSEALRVGARLPCRARLQQPFNADRER